MISVDHARGEDSDAFADLCELWCDEFMDGDMSRAKVETLFMFMVESGCVLIAREGQTPIGFVCGLAVERWFSDELVAMPFAVYVLPQYRSSTAADMLVWGYQEWAGRKGASCVEIIMPGGGYAQAFAGVIERAGFAPISQAFAWKPGGEIPAPNIDRH